MAKKLTKEAQLELKDIDENRGTEISIPRSSKKYKIKYLLPDTVSRISRMILGNEAPEGLFSYDENFKPDNKHVMYFMSKKILIVAKMASIIILNNFWKNTFFHWAHWRWLYYVKQYDFDQLSAIVVEGKKKMDAGGYYLSMVLSVSMMDTMRTMTKKEAEEYLAELMLASNQLSEKSTLGL